MPTFDQQSVRRISRAVRRSERQVRNRRPRRGRWGGKKTAIRLVIVTLDGGVEGSASTNCTFTYTIESLDGKELDTGLTPERARHSNTKYLAGGDTGAGSGSGGSGSGAGESIYGYARRVSDGWILLDVLGEIEDSGTC